MGTLSKTIFSGGQVFHQEIIFYPLNENKFHPSISSFNLSIADDKTNKRAI